MMLMLMLPLLLLQGVEISCYWPGSRTGGDVGKRRVGRRADGGGEVKGYRCGDTEGSDESWSWRSCHLMSEGNDRSQVTAWNALHFVRQHDSRAHVWRPVFH